MIEYGECSRKVLLLHVQECGCSLLGSVLHLLTVKADTKSIIICQ